MYACDVLNEVDLQISNLLVTTLQIFMSVRDIDAAAEFSIVIKHYFLQKNVWNLMRCGTGSPNIRK